MMRVEQRFHRAPTEAKFIFGSNICGHELLGAFTVLDTFSPLFGRLVFSPQGLVMQAHEQRAESLDALLASMIEKANETTSRLPQIAAWNKKIIVVSADDTLAQAKARFDNAVGYAPEAVDKFLDEMDARRAAAPTTLTPHFDQAKPKEVATEKLKVAP